MEVRTNKIGDIRSHYRRKLASLFTDREADELLFQLFTEITSMTKAKILSSPESTLTESELLRLHFGVKDLLKNKPIQYVLGKAAFYGLTFRVNSKVLIPRPETEELVQKAINMIPKGESLKVLDVGTGSGCIAVSLKHERPDCSVTAIDVSEFALEVASQNANDNKAKVDFKKVDFLDKTQLKSLEQFDLVVSNPPYVRNSEKELMKPNVLDYEPATALFVPDEDPLIFYEALADFCKDHLYPKGLLLAEINQYLAENTAALMVANGFKSVQVLEDHFGNPRILKVLT